MKRLSAWVRRKWLGLSLWTLFIVSSLLMFLSSSEQPLALLLRGTAVEPVLLLFPTGNQMVFDITVGIIVSLFIYVLVVWLPERSKRQRVQRSLQLHYDLFKEECIQVFLWALQGSYDYELVEQLKDRKQFRCFFLVQVSSDQNRWDAVFNGLAEDKIKRLFIALEILTSEILFTLSVIEVDDQKAFALLKRLAHMRYRGKNWSPGYDGIKQLCQFMWSIHTGWSMIDGYSERDVIAETIAAI